MVQPARISSIETATGILWEEWVKALAPYKDASHAEIARAATGAVI